MNDWDKDLDEIGCISRAALPETISMDVVDQIKTLTQENAALQVKCERLLQEAQGHSSEDDMHKAIVFELYNQKGDWNGAEPVIEHISALQAKLNVANEQTSLVYKSLDVRDKELEDSKAKVEHLKKYNVDLYDKFLFEAQIVVRYQHAIEVLAYAGLFKDEDEMKDKIESGDFETEYELLKESILANKTTPTPEVKSHE